MARDAEDRAVVYCPGQSVGERLQRIVQQPNEGGVRGPGNFRFTAGGKSFGSGVQAVLESGAVAQRDRIPDAGGIRRRTWAGLRYAPSAPSAVTTPTDSHKHWYIKWGQAIRVQIFPTEHLKIEPWFTNGWQAYGRFNNRPGFGFQILYRPNGWLSVLGNEYLLGEDALNTPGRVRYHTDDSLQIKYYDNPEKFLDKLAFSLTGDMGCEHGGGVSCDTNSAKGPKQDFLGFMFYNRAWFDHDLFGLTIGGGKINNPGRYLVLLPPINGANAASGTPYFTENPGDPYKAWDLSETFDYMPSQYITFRWEFDHRAANVPYFSGKGGITPPNGNTGAPGSMVPGFTPDLVKDENRLDLAILVKF